MGNHSHKKRKGSLEARVEPAVLHTYVENQATPESIPHSFLLASNVSKPRAARTVYGTMFLPFYVIIVSFFRHCIFFFSQDANKAESNCAIIGCNLSEKHKLTLYKTQSGEPTYGKNTFQEK